jgi:hypothetical protein
MMLRQVLRFIFGNMPGVMLRETIRIASFIRSHVACLCSLKWCLNDLPRRIVTDWKVWAAWRLLKWSIFLEKFRCGFHERPWKSRNNSFTGLPLLYYSCTQTAIINLYSVVKGAFVSHFVHLKTTRHTRAMTDQHITKIRTHTVQYYTEGNDSFAKSCILGSHICIRALYSDRTGLRTDKGLDSCSGDTVFESWLGQCLSWQRFQGFTQYLKTYHDNTFTKGHAIA